MTTEEMVDELSTMGKRVSPRLLIESVLYYYAAITLNKYNFRKSTGSSHITYFGLFFGRSSLGKDYTMNVIEKLFDLEKYPALMMAYYRNQIDMLPEEPDDIQEIRRYMPKSITVGIEGTSEGLYQVIQSQKSSNFGSLNLESREFTEHIMSSAGLLSKLKELSDGYLKAKIIKGDDQTELKADLVNIVTNFMALGSKQGANHEAKKELKRIVSSGLYRRTFIVDSNQLVEQNKVETNFKKTEEYLEALNENFTADFKERRKQDIFSEVFMEQTQCYTNRLEEIDTELITRAHENQLNEFAQYDTGSLNIIESLAHIICFLEWDPKVSSKHLNKAFSFFERTRVTVEDTFKSVHPYKLMYDLLKLKENMTISEMAEFESDIPIAKTKVLDNVALLEELCYRKDEILIKNEGKVTRFRIEALPVNKLDKLIFSIHDEGKMQYAINFKPLEMTWDQVKKLVVSEKVESFTTAHYEPSTKALDGHRAAKNYIEGANVIAFDIDEGMTISEAQELLSEFTYLIYTSKSHNIEKYNYRDRFRILFPIKNTFYVTVDQHKQLYINIELFLGITNNDIQTRNPSRLWYTNPNAILYENQGQLLDITPLLPSTDKSDDYLPKMNYINEQEDSGQISARVSGIIKWALVNATPGSRNTTLFKLGKFLKDINEEYEHQIISVNNMLNEPLHSSDLNTIIRSVNGK